MRRTAKFLAISLAGLLLLAGYVRYPPPSRAIQFPDGERYAFPVVDDSDLATLERIRPVYEVLNQYGVKTTKTVWVFPTSNPSHETNQGDWLADPGYREFIRELQSNGFEIALHGVRGGSSQRAEIIAGLDEFKRVLGHDPAIHVNHSLNRDNVYGGANRWSFPPLRCLYSAALGQRVRRRGSGFPLLLGGSPADEGQVRQPVHVRRNQSPECHAVDSLSPAGPSGGRLLVSDCGRRRSGSISRLVEPRESRPTRARGRILPRVCAYGRWQLQQGFRR